MPTPEEVAGSNNRPQKQDWLFEESRTPREILSFIRAGSKDSHDTHLAIQVLSVRISEEESKAAAKMERQTEKIVRLTWGLFWLTLALAFVAAIQLYIMLK